MPTRRDFIRLSTLAAAAGCAASLPRSAVAQFHPGGLIYGVQLYEVRRQLQQDLTGTLKKIAAIGFRQVEVFPPVYNRSAAELKHILEDAGLGSVSGHFDYATFESKIEFAHQLGLRYMVCPMIPQDHWGSRESFRKAAADFNRWGAAVRDAGMEFVFHNHDYEFKSFEGTSAWQILMDNTDPHLVKLELDVYWLAQAGQDPETMIKRYADRFRLFHLKDRTPNAPISYDMNAASQHFTELGQGSIPFPKLLELVHRAGVKYVYLDQDETPSPVFQSMAGSFAYLKRLNL
jgi:sugar phosphate isomerase/epimerase